MPPGRKTSGSTTSCGPALAVDVTLSRASCSSGGEIDHASSKSAFAGAPSGSATSPTSLSFEDGFCLRSASELMDTVGSAPSSNVRTTVARAAFPVGVVTYAPKAY